MPVEPDPAIVSPPPTLSAAPPPADLAGVGDALCLQWPEAVFVVDRGARVLWGNAATGPVLERLGEFDDPSGHPLSQMLGLEPPGERRLVAAVAGARLDLLVAAARYGVTLSLTVAPVRLTDGQIAAAVLVRDPTVSERALADATREQRLAEVARFAGAVAHEIRNPLTAVRGFVQLLCAAPPTGPALRYLEIIDEEMRRIERLTSDLLLLGRPPSERLEPCDLALLLRGTCELLGERAAAKGIALRLCVAAEAPVLGLGVAERLQQVFLNLVGNAIEATPPVGGVVRICVRPSPPRPDGVGGEVEVAVEDNGGGIPREALPRIFVPFFTTKAGGTGLGLAVSDSIVRGIGGHIAVESPPGSGATFTVRLPAAEPPDPGLR